MTDRLYPCGRCGAVFSTLEAAREHRDTCTGGTDDPTGGSGSTPEFTCGICGQMFSSHTALAAHALRCRTQLPGD